jgi:hypothetical protein
MVYPGGRFPQCDVCRRRIGTIHVQKIFQGRLISYYMCPNCAGTGESETLMKMGIADENDILQIVSRMMDMPIIELTGVEIKPSVLDLIPGDLVRKFRALPVTTEDNVVVVVFADPFDVVGIDEIEEILEKRGFRMRAVIGSEAEVDGMIDTLFQKE